MDGLEALFSGASGWVGGLFSGASGWVGQETCAYGGGGGGCPLPHPHTFQTQ